jgi:hypothetical protein
MSQKLQLEIHSFLLLPPLPSLMELRSAKEHKALLTVAAKGKFSAQRAPLESCLTIQCCVRSLFSLHLIQMHLKMCEKVINVLVLFTSGRHHSSYDICCHFFLT